MSPRRAAAPGGERLRLGSADITRERSEQFCLALYNIRGASAFDDVGEML